MIAALEFASCYVYSPSGCGRLSERSRLMRELLKEGDARFLKHYAERVQGQMCESPTLAGFLSSADVLVPVPGCMPRSDQGRYAATKLAQALLEQGLGRDTWNGLKRIRRVQKSAIAASSARPSVALHYESFSIDAASIDASPRAAQSLVLIDDIVTKGRTLFAAAVRLHEAFPAAHIRAFALLRTKGLTPEARRLLQPCRGLISFKGGDARREP